MNGRLARWAPLSGAVFVALWVVAAVLTFDSPDSNARSAKILAYYGKHSNRVQHIVAFFLVGVALLFFLWFLSTLRSRLAAAEGGAGRLTSLATIGGVVFVTLITAGAIVDFSYSATISDASRFNRDPNLFRLVSELSYFLVVLSLFAAAALVWAVAALAWRTRTFPRWLAGLGFFVGATCLVGFTGIPAALFAIWLLLLSGYLTWSQTAAAPAATS